MTTPAAKIRVMCVEDHRIVREGIALIINQEADMEVVGACATGDEAVPLYRQCRPDVVLMDLRLGKTSGVDAIKAIRLQDPNARIVVLTMYEGDEDIYRAHAGRSDHLPAEGHALVRSDSRRPCGACRRAPGTPDVQAAAGRACRIADADES